MAGERIAKIIHESTKKALDSTKATSIMFGIVTSLNPLEINVDSRYLIDEQFIILSSLCVKKTIDDTDEGLVLWRGLQVGDKVRMIKAQGGQLFYVLDREGGLTIL